MSKPAKHDDHLRGHRLMIASRATLASVLRLVPIPVLDELLSGAVRATLLQKIAEARGVGLDREAIEVLARLDGFEVIELAADAATAAALFRRSLRRLILPLRVAGRADEAVSTFAVATLFDHYCARHHVGLGLDGDAARVLKREIRAAIADARRAIAASAARRSARLALAPARAAMRLLRSGREETPDTVEAIDPAAAPTALGPLDAVARAWSRELSRAFDARWPSRRELPR